MHVWVKQDFNWDKNRVGLDLIDWIVKSGLYVLEWTQVVVFVTRFEVITFE